VGFSTNPAIARAGAYLKNRVPVGSVFDVDSWILVSIQTAPAMRTIVPSNMQIIQISLPNVFVSL
jgi:hypothetical protein